MVTKQQWREYFKMMNDREPSLEEFQAAIEKGEIEDLRSEAQPSAYAQQNYSLQNPFFPRKNTAEATSNHPTGMFESFKLFWINYVNFTGRSRRSEFWWTCLVNSIISFILFIPGLIVLFINFFYVIATGRFDGYYYHGYAGSDFALLGGALLTLVPGILFGLAILIPSLALFFRRLRDTGLGTMNIVALIVFHVVLFILGYLPILGFLFDIALFALWIYIIVLLVRESDYYVRRSEPITDWFARLFKN